MAFLTFPLLDPVVVLSPPVAFIVGVIFVPNALTEVLDPNKPITLQYIENKEQTVTFEYCGPNGVETFDMAVGLATTVQFILAELCNRHGLTEPDWALWVNNVALNPWQILDDYAPFIHLKLTLRRHSAQ